MKEKCVSQERMDKGPSINDVRFLGGFFDPLLPLVRISFSDPLVPKSEFGVIHKPRGQDFAHF